MIATLLSPRHGPARANLRAALPYLAGAGAGLLVAGGMLCPDALFLRLLWSSGVAAWLPPEHLPPGGTVRLELCAVAAAAVAAVAWAVAYLLLDTGGPLSGWASTGALPPRRRADLHPDAPPRPPLRLTHMPPAERRLPTDLDQTLASFDPAAIVRPAKTVPAAPVPTAPVPAAPPRGSDALGALLGRLERGLDRRRSAA